MRVEVVAEHNNPGEPEGVSPPEKGWLVPVNKLAEAVVGQNNPGVTGGMSVLERVRLVPVQHQMDAVG